MFFKEIIPFNISVKISEDILLFFFNNFGLFKFCEDEALFIFSFFKEFDELTFITIFSKAEFVKFFMIFLLLL